MTEAEWLACDDPVMMLHHLGVVRGAPEEPGASPGRASARQLRLFACALFRQLIAHGTHMSPNNHATIARVEGRPDRPPPADPNGPSMGWAAPLRDDLATGIHNILGIAPLTKRGPGTVPRALQATLLREVLGNPFRTPALPPAALAWNDSQVVRLAQAANRHRARPSGELNRTRLAILADALEDAGCLDADVLGHLRAPGPHVRGCWVVGLILGKE